MVPAARNSSRSDTRYRWLAERVRETAQKVSTESERAELLARARMWDFLADHGPRVRAHE
jgi:hypothetical protein